MWFEIGAQNFERMSAEILATAFEAVDFPPHRFCIAGGCGGSYGDDVFLSVLGECVEKISRIFIAILAR